MMGKYNDFINVLDDDKPLAQSAHRLPIFALKRIIFFSYAPVVIFVKDKCKCRMFSALKPLFKTIRVLKCNK